MDGAPAPMTATRRLILAGGLGLAAGGAWTANAAPVGAVPASEPDDMILGNPKARVTVIEYASVGCPHCAHWANETFAPFKARFIDSGKVRFVLRECITGDAPVAVAGFLLARRAGPAKYFQVVEGMFAGFEPMHAPGGTPDAVMRPLAKSVGLTDADYEAAVMDPDAFTALRERSERHFEVDKVDSTPTFFLNGQKLDGAPDLAAFTTAINAALKKR